MSADRAARKASKRVSRSPDYQALRARMQEVQGKLNTAVGQVAHLTDENTKLKAELAKLKST